MIIRCDIIGMMSSWWPKQRSTRLRPYWTSSTHDKFYMLSLELDWTRLMSRRPLLTYSLLVSGAQQLHRKHLSPLRWSEQRHRERCATFYANENIHYVERYGARGCLLLAACSYSNRRHCKRNNKRLCRPTAHYNQQINNRLWHAKIPTRRVQYISPIWDSWAHLVYVYSLLVSCTDFACWVCCVHCGREMKFAYSLAETS